MSINFEELLSKQAGEAEKPLPFPVGHYVADIVGYDTVEVGDKRTPAVEITYRLTTALADVDPDEFEQAGGNARLAKVKVRQLLWLTEDALYRLDTYLGEVCGLELEGKQYSELLPELTGVTDLVLEISHRPSKSGEEIYLDVKKVHAPDFEVEG